jgi:Ca2+-binding EF-hand superfamily protein
MGACGSSCNGSGHSEETQRPKGSLEVEDPVLAALMKFDVNGDGLTKEEFKQALRAFRFSMSSQKCRAIRERTFADCDADGNGRLSVKELASGMPVTLRNKIQKRLDEGWAFDPSKWE